MQPPGDHGYENIDDFDEQRHSNPARATLIGRHFNLSDRELSPTGQIRVHKGRGSVRVDIDAGVQAK